MSAGFRGLYIGIFLISLWSWYTTGAGWNAFLSELPAIWPFGLAAVLQYLLALMALRVLPGGQSLVAWPVAVVLYIILAIGSVTFSIGFYFQLTAAEDYAERIFSDQYQAVRQDAEALRLAYEEGADKLEDFAAFSRDMAEQEAERGGTCRRDRGGGRGAFYNLRQFQAERFTTLADEVQQRQSRIAEAFAAIRAIKERNDLSVKERLQRLKERYSDLQIVYNQNVGGLAPTLRDHRQWHAQGYPDDQKYAAFAGEQYACADGLTLSRFDDMIDILARLPEPEDYEIQVFDPTDERAVIIEVFMEVLGVFFPGVLDDEGESAVEQEIFSETYIMAVSLGLLVDSLILLLGIFVQLAYRPNRIFWRRVPSPTEVSMVSDLFVKFHERCRHLRYLNDARYVAAPIELDVGRSGQRPESAGAAADFVENVLEKLELQVEQGSYLFEPEQQAVIDDIGVELQDLVRDVREILSDLQMIGEPAYNRGSDFMGRGLSALKANFGIDEGALDDNGLFTAYQIYPSLQEKIIQRTKAYASARIDRVPGVRSWWQMLHLWRNADYAHHLALMLEGNDRARARYVHGKLWPGTRRIVLFPNNEIECRIHAWLRTVSEELDFHDHVAERPMRLLGIALPLPWRILELDHQAARTIAELAHAHEGESD